MECQSPYVMLKREVIVHLVLEEEEEEEGEDGVEDRVVVEGEEGVAGAEVSPFFFHEQHEPSLLPHTPHPLSFSFSLCRWSFTR